MPISVSCQCGQKFAAKDGLAGKKVQCPKCKNALEIPVTGTPSRSSQEASESQKPIRFRCKCEHAITVKADAAGRKVKCPKCDSVLVVPRPAKGAQQPVAAGARASRTSVSTDVADIPGGFGGVGDLLDELGMEATRTGVRCPECNADMTPEAILCVQCGFNLETGKKLETKVIKRADPVKGGGGVPGNLKGGTAGGTRKSIPKSTQSLISALNILGTLNVIILGIGVVAMMSLVGQANAPEAVGFGVGMAVAVAIFGLPIVGAIFGAAHLLKKGSKIGWVLALILAVLSLPSFPIGTIIGALLLKYALSAETRNFVS
ncbi:MAG: hypothetical protein R3E01_15910 [Pirellulaceae bacterium]|nr:hypothetical protein [Planctomycetales bacterium]